MKKFPKKAGKVRDFICAHVKRPMNLPTINPFSCGSLAFVRPVRKLWRRDFIKSKKTFCCPLGLLRTSREPIPLRIDDLGIDDVPFSIEEMEAFYSWWDSEANPKKAVDTVWGRIR